VVHIIEALFLTGNMINGASLFGRENPFTFNKNSSKAKPSNFVAKSAFHFARQSATKKHCTKVFLGALGNAQCKTVLD